MKIEGNMIRVKFHSPNGKLTAKALPPVYDVKTIIGMTAPLIRNSPNSELEGFSICGADRKWVWAEARIERNSVVVWSDNIPAPTAVRYAWADNPTCNLFDTAGLPASPFRTDNFPCITVNNRFGF